MKLAIKLLVVFLFIASASFFSCSSEDSVLNNEPSLIVKIKFDPTQIRLNNLGQVSVIPEGNAAQTPDFKKISAHYLEFAPSSTTSLGQGEVIYHGPETDLGGSMAIDFSQAKVVSDDEIFLKIPLKDIATGSYEWVRVSLTYQSGSIQILNQGTIYSGTLDSFVGFNTYIGTHSIDNNVFPVNMNKPQGYWAFALNGFPYTTSGQAPAGATTVPNPLFSSSPIPQGSCVVTGKFSNNLLLTGNEKKDVTVELSLSINQSFEWTEITPDGKYEPSIGEQVVDMGIRGLIPRFSK